MIYISVPGSFKQVILVTLQQLRYIIAITEAGSIGRAAQRLFITQPTLSKAVIDLEKEVKITIFIRDNRGVYPTDDGFTFLSYARQVIEQADLLENKYKGNTPIKRIFAISSQHYSFVVSAFVALVQEYGENHYDFTLRESRTYDIIEDVRTQRSELGILYLSHYNHDILLQIIRKADLLFTPLFTATPHVFISRNNPLATQSHITLEDLKNYPRLTYEQGIHNSFYYSEELHSTENVPKNIVVTDRATLFNLLIGLNGYTICSGIISKNLNGPEIVAVPLDSTEIMQLGYIYMPHRPLSPLSKRYLEHLHTYITKLSD